MIEASMLIAALLALIAWHENLSRGRGAYVKVPSRAERRFTERLGDNEK